ncbi:MAG: hypothetical protein LCI00_04035 [Chloroflexi bacterium]|nr:hypothetical protein [Chloroflexota bacterium]MCC6891207.1 hypothetical protein [Anaerolineae bacterium]
MANIAPPQPVTSRSTIDPQRRAWGVMLLSFAVFCTICLVVGVGLIYFFFQSTVALEGVLEVARGSGGISGQESVRSSAGVANNDRLSTDPLSQVTVFLRDQQREKPLIAAITLRGDTSVRLVRGLRPRFQWSRGEYTIELQDFRGELMIFSPKDLAHQLNMSIITNAGDLIYVRAGGQYIVRASDTRVQVINQDGDIILKPANVDIGRAVPSNSQALITYAESAMDVTVSATYTNLLSDVIFQDSLNAPSTEQVGFTQPFNSDWFCKDNSIPQGYAVPQMSDGRTVLRLVRAEDATSHGETGCVRSWGEGRNVASFNYISLRATFRINYQSLSTCGQDGSECPLMLLVEYLDKNGELHRWYHGFYARVDPDRNFPLQCNSCLQEHERINEKAWFTYDSGNLLNLLTNPEQLAEQRPITIIDVQFKASGHQYDIEVSDMMLLADLGTS